MYMIAQMFDGLPVIFLRYNPDTFYDKTGKKSKISLINRQNILVNWVTTCLMYNKETCKGYTVKYLFYDGYDICDNTFITINEVDVVL